MTIYQITNTINGKIYIGKTIKTIEQRFKQHISVSRRQTATQSNTVLHRAIRKYGTESFTITELESGFNSEDDLNEAEIRYISELSPQYNMTEGGEGISGHEHSSETRKKISETHKGKKLSEDHIRKISEAKKGKKLSEDHIRKMSESRKGKPKSEEHKRKMSEAFKGRNRSEETKRKISESLKGRKRSEETKRKISESVKRRNLQKAKV